MGNQEQVNIADEVREFIGMYVSASDEQLDAMTLYALATHGMEAFVTFGRMLWWSELEESGKTLAMTVTASVCSNPLDTSGSMPAVDAAMRAAAKTPEVPARTPFRDEISDVFSKSGAASNNHPIAEYLRKGYKRGATRSNSRNGVDEPYSIFTPFLLTGLRATCVPRDIRSRCVIIHMQPGKPRKYFDVRESEAYATALAKSVSTTVRGQMGALRRFRARGLHPKLANRKLEVWESLLAVAYVLGGQRWLNKGVAAFAALALDESDQPALTPRQQVIRDVAEIASTETLAGPFVTSDIIADELRRLDNPIYEGRSHHGLVCLTRDSLPCKSGRVTVNGEQVRAYRRADILDAWENERPADPDDVEIPEDTDDLSSLESWDVKADTPATTSDSEAPEAKRAGDKADKTGKADVSVRTARKAGEHRQYTETKEKEAAL